VGGDLPEIGRWINGGIDADNLTALAKAFGQPASIIHLAGGSLVSASILQPGEDFRRSVDTAQRLLDWTRSNAADTRIVIASSAAVYGDAHSGPIPEFAGYAPKSPYGAHKAMVELLTISYARQFSLNVSIVRLFSVYGPGLRKQLVWELANRVMMGETRLTLGGVGEELRDFLYISDAAAMLLDASEVANNEAPVFNGASGVARKIRDVAAAIARGVEVTFSGLVRAGDPASLVADVTRARSAGFCAKTGFEDGLKETLAWIAANRGDGWRAR
jgi:UDP-glucose 4-epimerase